MCCPRRRRTKSASPPGTLLSALLHARISRFSSATGFSSLEHHFADSAGTVGRDNYESPGKRVRNAPNFGGIHLLTEFPEREKLREHLQRGIVNVPASSCRDTLDGRTAARRQHVALSCIVWIVGWRVFYARNEGEGLNGQLASSARMQNGRTERGAGNRLINKKCSLKLSRIWCATRRSFYSIAFLLRTQGFHF